MKLAIFGDSWACGEWDTPDGSAESYQITHGGITEYLKDQFDISNYAVGGNSLWQLALMLDRYFDMARALPPRPTHCLVIQTSADRVRECERFGIDYDQIIDQSVDIEAFYASLVDIWYHKLEAICLKYQTKVYLVGGLSDLDLSRLTHSPNLIPLCPSWLELIYPSHQITQVPMVPDLRLFDRIATRKNHQLMQSILNHYDSRFLEFNHISNLPTFGPIDFHPNRQGHELLAKHISNFFKGEVNE
jgi:hypothetical protein